MSFPAKLVVMGQDLFPKSPLFPGYVGTTHREVTHLISPEHSTVIPGGWWLALCPRRMEDSAVHRLAFCIHPAHRLMCIFLSPCSEDRKKAQHPPPCSLGWCHRLEQIGMVESFENCLEQGAKSTNYHYCCHHHESLHGGCRGSWTENRTLGCD